MSTTHIDGLLDFERVRSLLHKPCPANAKRKRKWPVCRNSKPRWLDMLKDVEADVDLPKGYHDASAPCMHFMSVKLADIC